MTKKFAIISIFLLLIITTVHGLNTTIIKQQSTEDLYKIVCKRDISEVKRELYKEYLATQIPNMFVEEFYNSTNHDIDLGLELLAIGDKESQWSLKGLVSKNVNKDGSIDVGPLQLNSNNLKNKWFLELFAPEKYESMEANNFYMVTCINYFACLKNEYSSIEKALKVYNGGPRAIRRNSSNFHTTNLYATSTLMYLENRKEEWELFLKGYYNDRVFSQIQEGIQVQHTIEFGLRNIPDSNQFYYERYVDKKSYSKHRKGFSLDIYIIFKRRSKSIIDKLQDAASHKLIYLVVKSLNDTIVDIIT